MNSDGHAHGTVLYEYELKGNIYDNPELLTNYQQRLIECCQICQASGGLTAQKKGKLAERTIASVC